MRLRRGVVAVLAAGALLAASCGGDDTSSSSEEGGTTETSVKSEVEKEVEGTKLGETATTEAGATTETTEAPAAYPTSMEEWEELWASEREAIVKNIKDNKWGLQADGKITGPDGFMIDTTKCPAGWDNTEGLSDKILIGNPTPASGTLADAGNISKGGVAILKYYSEQPGFFKDSEGVDRKVEVLLRDDGYDPARTIVLVDEYLTSDKAFAIWGLGSPSVMKTYGKINEFCVPHPFAVTGHPAWGDPVNHPWTSGILLAYNTEAVLWGAFIDQRIDELTAGDGKATIAALIMNNDFGKAYDLGFKTYLASSPNKDKIEYVNELIEPQAPTVTDPMTTLAAKKPDMFIQMLAGTSCSQTIIEVEQNGMRQSAKYLMAASVCKASTYTGDAAVGTAAEGWWIMGGGFRDYNSPVEDDTAFIVFAREELKKSGLDSKASGNLGVGFTTGWGFAQVLKVAGELDGGLTRANFVVAMRAMDMTHPGYLEGIRWNLNGAKDAYWIEGTEVGKYDHAKQVFAQQGDIIDLSGKSANCAWDQSIGNCK